MSFWNELSTPIKGVVAVGGILIVLVGGYLAFGGGGDVETTQQRGLSAAPP